MGSIALLGGTIVDGTGGPAYRGDLLVREGRIEAITRFEEPPEARIYDCSGLVVAPGFIDAHSHSDLQVLEPRLEKVQQGVTTEVVGNCGFSPYPASDSPQQLRDFANGIFCGGESWGWPRAANYLAETRRSSLVHVESLVGHGSLRIWRNGPRQGPLEASALDSMCGRLAESLQEGACGMSSGLMYAPGSSAPIEELEALCRVVEREGKIYATHMRNYSDKLIEAVDEQLQLASRTGCRLQISHFQAVGARNWHLQAQALERIEAARVNGVDVGLDCYPYVRGSTVLTQVLPQWALDGGTDALLARLRDSIERKTIAREAEADLAQGWENIFISAVGSLENRPLVGSSIAHVAELRGCEPVEAAFDLLQEENGQVNILEINQSEENLRQVLTHAESNIISDGFYVKGNPHPRLYGTFPFLLGEIVRDRKWLTLAEAVYKITALPAMRLNMRDRGRLAPGFHADVTVFDPAAIDGPANYENPTLPPLGIAHVFRSGERVAGEKRFDC